MKISKIGLALSVVSFVLLSMGCAHKSYIRDHGVQMPGQADSEIVVVYLSSSEDGDYFNSESNVYLKKGEKYKKIIKYSFNTAVNSVDYFLVPAGKHTLKFQEGFLTTKSFEDYVNKIPFNVGEKKTRVFLIYNFVDRFNFENRKLIVKGPFDAPHRQDENYYSELKKLLSHEHYGIRIYSLYALSKGDQAEFLNILNEVHVNDESEGVRKVAAVFLKDHE